MEITAALVKELREKTGAGMMDCKRALTEANGNFEKAIELLRKKGASVAAKRAERSASEGIILTKLFNNNKSAAIIEVNCETDFVAKSDDFLSFSKLALEALIANKPSDVEALLNSQFDKKKIKDELTSIIGRIGEKIEISRFVLENAYNGLVVDYIHHGAKLGVLLKADKVPADKGEAFAAIIKDIAMQIAAMKPLCIYREEVPKDTVEKEIDIYKELAKKEGKPEQILEKIAQGRLNKFYEENCLNEQVYVKDNSKKIGELIAEFNKANSCEARLVLFHRFHVSDEKK